MRNQCSFPAASALKILLPYLCIFFSSLIVQSIHLCVCVPFRQSLLQCPAVSSSAPRCELWSPRPCGAAPPPDAAPAASSSAPLGCAPPPYASAPPASSTDLREREEKMWETLCSESLSERWRAKQGKWGMEWTSDSGKKYKNGMNKQRYEACVCLEGRRLWDSPCLMSMTWCSCLAASISCSSFSCASLMFLSTCSNCCFSISMRAFQRIAYSYSNEPGWAKRGGCSRSLTTHTMRKTSILRSSVQTSEVCMYTFQQLQLFW